jgi:SAM-dependent methyltransferase
MFSELIYMLRIAKRLHGVHPRVCPACGYVGKFHAFGMPPRFDAQCPHCRSLERHRLLLLSDQKASLIRAGSDILHVAPEPVVRDYLRGRCSNYISLDLFSKDADVHEPIENTSFSDESFDHIVCSHVLEHVDDDKALREMFRLLRCDGTLLLMVPIVEGWEKTYEYPAVSKDERDLHFGQSDHVRYYGRDLRERMSRVGFSFREFTAQGTEAVKFGLTRGEKVFVALKS